MPPAAGTARLTAAQVMAAIWRLRISES